MVTREGHCQPANKPTAASIYWSCQRTFAKLYIVDYDSRFLFFVSLSTSIRPYCETSRMFVNTFSIYSSVIFQEIKLWPTTFGCHDTWTKLISSHRDTKQLYCGQLLLYLEIVGIQRFTWIFRAPIMLVGVPHCTSCTPIWAGPVPSAGYITPHKLQPPHLQHCTLLLAWHVTCSRCLLWPV